MIELVTQTDLQPESIIQRTLTLVPKVRMVENSYGALIMRMALLIFACLLFRMMIYGTELTLMAMLVAIIFCLLISLVLLILLDCLTKVYGTRKLILYMFCMSALAAIFLIALAL